jgi:MoxR-like ATPases
MVGPPGTAKSYLAASLARLLSARFYVYLLTKFTTYDDIFGPVDIVALSQGQYRRVWSSIINAEIVFLDEIFKASTAVLNTLLLLLQERVVYDPFSGAPMAAQLWTLIGASNETPQEEELQALYDRFAVKVFVKYLDDDVKLLTALQARWQNGAAASAVASMDDVKALHDYSIKLLSVGKIKDVGETLKLYHINVVPLAKSLRAKGILVSDRTLVEKLPKLYAAYLAVNGVTADNLINAAYEIIKYAARTPEELREIEKIINEALGEVAELSRKLEQAKSQLRAGNLEQAKALFREVATYDVSRLQNKPWLRPRIEALVSVAQSYVKKIEEIKRQIEEE